MIQGVLHELRSFLRATNLGWASLYDGILIAWQDPVNHALK